MFFPVYTDVFGSLVEQWSSHSPLDVAVRGKQDPCSEKQLKGFGFVFLLKAGKRLALNTSDM